MLRIILALFIIAHGLVHAGLAMAPNPADADEKPFAFFTSAERSWVLPKLGLNPDVIKWIGFGLVGLSTLGFVLAGLGIFGVPGLMAIWRGLAVAASAVSLILLFLFWHKWLPIGVLIDIAVIVALLAANWPTDALLGR